MSWTVLNFGKHEGKTLPQVMLSDPDWFFWAMEKNVFSGSNSKYSEEAKVVLGRARMVKIPDNVDKRLIVEHTLMPRSTKYVGFDIIEAHRPLHEGSSPTFRNKVVDFSVPRTLAPYDKLGYQNFLKAFKFYILGNGKIRITAKVANDFFSNTANFVKS